VLPIVTSSISGSTSNSEASSSLKVSNYCESSGASLSNNIAGAVLSNSDESGSVARIDNIVIDTSNARQTRTNSTNISTYDDHMMQLMNLQNKISDNVSLDSLLKDNNFHVEDHLLNIVNIEVVIKSLQLKNCDYIQNVVVAFLSKQFNVMTANKIGLVKHLDRLASLLFTKLDTAIAQYSKMIAITKKESKDTVNIANFDDSNLQNAYKSFEDSIYQSISLDNKVKENEAIPLAFNKNDLKKRINTVIVNVIKFVSDAYQHYLKLESSKTFLSFVRELCPIYINKLRVTSNINRSALNAFYCNIFIDQLVINARTIYDCVSIHKLAVTKGKSRKPVTSNEIKSIFEKKIGPIDQRKIDLLVNEFNNVRTYTGTKELIFPELVRPKKVKYCEKSVDEEDFIDSEDEYDDYFKAPKKVKYSDSIKDTIKGNLYKCIYYVFTLLSYNLYRYKRIN